jgi:dipeptide transport system ATP-binding protein
VFATRCPYVTDRCRSERPALRPVGSQLVACHYAEQFLQGAPAPGAFANLAPAH